MSRVNPTEVKEIISTTLRDPVVQVWIDAAHCIVTDNADCMGGVEETLKKVELYLSCHYLALSNPSIGGIIRSEKIQDMSTTYSTAERVSELINTTSYGIVANSLSNGCLANTSDRAISFAALGGKANSDCCE